MVPTRHSEIGLARLVAVTTGKSGGKTSIEEAFLWLDGGCGGGGVAMRAGNLLLVVKYTRLEEQVPPSPRGTKDCPPMVETTVLFSRDGSLRKA